MKTIVALVGGFYGAGKTTLIWEIAQELMQSGTRVGMVANDETTELAGVHLAQFLKNQSAKDETQPSFCNYRGFTEAIAKVKKEERAEVILAEPTESCMAMSAAVLKRLKDEFGDEIIIAPYTVVIDPDRLEDLLVGRDTLFHNSTLYVIGKQLEEADIIAVSKTDRRSPEEVAMLIKKAGNKWPEAEVIGMNAANREGVAEWIKQAAKGQTTAFREVEYDEEQLAEGESALSLFRTTLGLRGNVDWSGFAEELMDRLNERFRQADAAVGHVKVLVSSGKDLFMQGSLAGYEKYLKGIELPWEKDEVQMKLNVRVQLPQDELQQIIRDEFRSACKDKDVKVEKL